MINPKVIPSFMIAIFGAILIDKADFPITGVIFIAFGIVSALLKSDIDKEENW